MAHRSERMCVQVNRTLTVLNLSDNYLGAEGAAVIADALRVAAVQLVTCE